MREIGSSTFKGRDRERKLTLLKHILDNTEQLKNEVMKSENNSWLNTCRRYFEEVGLTLEEMTEGVEKVWRGE